MHRIFFLFYRFLYNIKNGNNSKFNKTYRFIEKSQYWSDKKMQEYQLVKLNRLLICTKERSEYYQNTLRNLNLPFKTLDLFQNIVPAISKNEIIDNKGQILINKKSKKFKFSTSGSTGDPLVVYISPEAKILRQALVKRFLKWWNIELWDKSVLIWGFKKKNNNNTFPGRLKKYIRNRMDINVFSLNEKTFIGYYKKIEKFKPKYIRGYKSGLLQFAELMELNNLQFKATKLKVVIVTSEVLMPEERSYMERLYRCKVANEFGSAESGLFAYECPEGSMHINEEAVYLYQKNNDLYVTEFNNSIMPLINYKNDDRVFLSSEKCKCGRNSRVINKIEGRLNDYIIKEDGSKTSQYFFYYLFKELDEVGLSDCIKKYKVIQRSNSFYFYLVKGENFNQKFEVFIKERMINEIGSNIELSFIYCEKIPLEKSGKLRFFKREK